MAGVLRLADCCTKMMAGMAGDVALGAVLRFAGEGWGFLR